MAVTENQIKLQICRMEYPAQKQPKSYTYQSAALIQQADNEMESWLAEVKL